MSTFRIGELVYDIDIMEPAIVSEITATEVYAQLPSGWRMGQESECWLSAVRCGCDALAVEQRNLTADRPDDAATREGAL